MKIALWMFLVAGLLASSVVAIRGWKAVATVGEQNQILAVRLQKAEERAGQQQVPSEGQGISKLESELLRLRNEIGQLRALKPEVERLRAENARLRALLDSERFAAQADWTAWLSTARTNWVKPADLPYLLQALTNDATAVRLEAARALRNIGLQRIFDTNLSSEVESQLGAEAKAAVPGLV